MIFRSATTCVFGAVQGPPGVPFTGTRRGLHPVVPGSCFTTYARKATPRSQALKHGHVNGTFHSRPAVVEVKGNLQQGRPAFVESLVQGKLVVNTVAKSLRTQMIDEYGTEGFVRS